MELFVLGVILGILLRDIKTKVIRSNDPLSAAIRGYYHGSTQFIEPVSKKEKFDQANSIDDILQ